MVPTSRPRISIRSMMIAIAAIAMVIAGERFLFYLIAIWQMLVFGRYDPSESTFVFLLLIYFSSYRSRAARLVSSQTGSTARDAKTASNRA